MNERNKNRIYCKYGDCCLEKLEYELKILDKIWSKLENKWSDPDDYEDLYRVYTLLDITSALARKRLIDINGRKNDIYKVKVVEETDRREVDTSVYIFSEEYGFFNGDKKEILLANVVSTCLHGGSYVYMDNRKSYEQINGFDIYVCIETDIRKQYIDVRSYIESMKKLVKDQINSKK